MADNPAPERWLLLHSKGTDNEELEDLRTQIVDTFAKTGRTIELTLGKEDFQARAMVLGGWGPWSDGLARCRLPSGEPRYEGFIIPGYPAVGGWLGGPRMGPLLGKPTYAIARSALSGGKAVTLFDSRTETFTGLVRVDRTLSDDYVAWGRCYCEETP